MARKGTSHLTCWTKQFDKGEEIGDKGKEKGERRKRGKKREEEGGERSSTFSLDFPEIQPSAFVGARDKVNPHSESYLWVPKSRSFDKLQEVGDFPNRCHS